MAVSLSTESRQARPSRSPAEPIAIVGIGCRLPGGASSPGQFWANLLDGVSGVVEVPEERWSLEGFYDPEPGKPGRSVTKWGGFVDRIDQFDAGFFGISPREAAEMDPQQRLMLQVAWEALEDAGVPADGLAGTMTGVFVGVSINDYAFLQNHHRATDSIHAGTGTALSIVANRISHRLDLRGPSVAVDTACSSSLVALDLACRNLWDGHCDLALSGGVNALLDPGGFLFFSAAGMMSTDGRVHAFDADANGFVRAEGGGVVVLKTLSRAEADGDRIYAVIRATAVNQDGNTATLTAPNQAAQAAMLGEVCRRADIDPAEVAYVEAHGTGTPIGDPIEAGAIGEVFGQAPKRNGRVAIGSVKTLTGHLESAAGIAGLIKTTLALHHGLLPANLNYAKPSPHIAFDELNIEVVTEPRPLDGERPLAVVNSFGFGGTNGCALLQSAPAVAPAEACSPADRDGAVLVPVSAATPAALRALACELARMLGDAGSEAPPLADIAGTAALHRAHLAQRLAVVAGSTAELVERLTAFAEERPAPGLEDGAPAVLVSGRREDPAPLAFVFAGQGGQSWRMARDLLLGDAVFRRTVDAFDVEFKKLAGWSVIDELMADEASSRINSTFVTQPAIFAVQIGLVERWRAWGIEPDVVIGHSFGEVAAAHTAGALTLSDAVRIIYHRGRLQDETQGSGGMAALAMAADDVRARLRALGETRVEIAADNAPEMVTLAGESEALKAFLDGLLEEDPDLFCRTLKVDYAAHSQQMESIRDAFIDGLGDLSPQPASLPMISTVTGAAVGEMRLDAGYWWRNVREPVLFQPALAAAAELGCGTFVEMGPHATLSGIVSTNLAAQGRKGLAVPSLHAQHGSLDQLLASLAALHVRGVPVRWAGLVDSAHRRVALPPYPWEQQRFWADSEESRAAMFQAAAHPLLGVRQSGPLPVWSNEVSVRRQPYIADHRVDGAVVFPGAGYVDMLLAAVREVHGDGACELEGVTFLEALFLPEEQSIKLQTVLDPERRLLRIYSRVRDGSPDWTLRVHAGFRHGASRVTPFVPSPGSGEPVGPDAFYNHTRSNGHDYGPTFQGVSEVRPGDGGCVGRIALPEPLVGRTEGYVFHPAMLDACLQVGIGVHGISTDSSAAATTIQLPTSAARLRVFKQPPNQLHVDVRLVHEDARGASCDIVVSDLEGETVLIIDGFASRKLPSRAARSGQAAELLPYQELWQESALELSEESTTAVEPGLWLLLADTSGTADALAIGLRARGAEPVRAVPGDAFARVDEATFTVRIDAPEDLHALIDAIVADGRPLAGVVDLWPLEIGVADTPAGSDLLQAQEPSVFAALELVKSLARHEALAPRLYIAVRGAHFLPVERDAAAPLSVARLAQAPLAGFARTAANEQPQLRLTVIDLDPLSTHNGEGAAADLMGEIATDGPELEIALRGELRYVNRVDATALDALPRRRVPVAQFDPTHDWRLTMSAAGVFDNMFVGETPRLQPGLGEVTVAVEAVGINFHDILSAAGMMPEGSEDIDAFAFLGLECAGVVREVGDGVSGLAPGDRVMTSAKGCLGSAVVAPAIAVQKVPDDIAMVAAATMPTAFTTAHYALNRVGRMAPGEKVLIHVATGGVGLAAIQLARLAGCEIFATAGSERKRDFLRSLGIEHVMDSRSLDFADEVLAATGGRGVDMVLNSLPGPFIDKGLAILAPYGRFLEIGKRDLFADKPIGLRALRNSNAFLTIDLDSLGQDRPDEFADVFADVAAMLAEGKISPLPAETFPLTRVADAFRHMSKALHIGKVVIETRDPAVEVALDPERPLSLRADGAYLVTGGLGGFGLEVARWLARGGAGQLVLMSRSGAASEEATAAVRELEAQGTQVDVIAGDVTASADVARAVAAAGARGRSLRGVVHAAMVLDDAFITQLDRDRFTTALAPKMVGGWNLHTATLGEKLDFFVLFSSVAALLGSTGQANYVAGNAFLDALAAFRRASGLPAVSVAWGALGGQGFVARNEAIARYLDSQGIAPIETEEALAWLGRSLQLDPGTVAVLRLDWGKLSKAQTALTTSPRVAHLLSGNEGGAKGGSFRGQLLAAPPARQPAVLSKFLKGQVARVLRVEAATIEPDRSLSELGLDSLTSFELKNRIESEIGVSLPASKFLQKPTIAGLSETILDVLLASVGSDAETVESAAAYDDDHSGMPLSAWQIFCLDMEQRAPLATAIRDLNRLIFGAAVSPRVDVARLRRVIETGLSRHPGLLYTFVNEPAGPEVRLLDQHPQGLVVFDVSDLDDLAFQAFVESRRDAAYDLAKGPLIRVELLHRHNDTDVLLLCAHHSIVDGWSLMLLFSEFFADYFDAGDTLGANNDQDGFDALEFARWQRRFMAGVEGQSQLAYWLERLREPGPALNLPYDRTPNESGKVAIRRGDIGKAELSRATSAAVRELAVATGTTSFVVLLAAFKLFLHQLTARADLLVTSTVAARTRPELERTIGSLRNYVVFRTELEPNWSLRRLVAEVADTVADGLANQDYPGFDLFDRVEPGYVEKRTALDQVGFYMLRPDNLDDRGFGELMLFQGGKRVTFGSIEIETLSIEEHGCYRELSIYELEHEGLVHLLIHYDADMFTAATAERLLQDYQATLRAALAKPDTTIAELAVAFAGTHDVKAPED